MRNTRIISIGILSMAISLTAVSGQVRRRGARAMTLKEVASLAMEKNPAVAAAVAEKTAAEAQTRQARSMYWPRVDFTQSFTNGNNPVYVFGSLLGQQAFTVANFDIEALNRPDPLNNFKSELTVYQSIWEGGKTQARNRLARLNETFRDQETKRVCQGLLFEVIRNYFAVQLAEENLATVESSRDSAEASLKRIQDMYASGLVVQSDLLRMRVYLADVERQRLDAENQVYLARAALEVDLGKSVPPGFFLATPLSLPPDGLPGEGEFQQQAAVNRPELSQLQTAVAMAGQQVRAARGGYYPGIGLFSTVEYDQGTGSDRSGVNYIVGAQLRLNLFEGQAKGARVAEARANQAAAEANLANFQNRVSLQVKEAWLKTGTSRLQHRVAEEAVGQAEEGLRIVRNRYEAGLATLTDLLAAETALSGARTNLSAAIYQCNLNLAGLELAAGKLSLESKIFE